VIESDLAGMVGADTAFQILDHIFEMKGRCFIVLKISRLEGGPNSLNQ
jgi:hypothetical protein